MLLVKRSKKVEAFEICIFSETAGMTVMIAIRKTLYIRVIKPGKSRVAFISHEVSLERVCLSIFIKIEQGFLKAALALLKARALHVVRDSRGTLCLIR